MENRYGFLYCNRRLKRLTYLDGVYFRLLKCGRKFSLSNRNPVHPQKQQEDQKGVKVTNEEFYLCVCGVHFRYEYKYSS